MTDLYCVAYSMNRAYKTSGQHSIVHFTLTMFILDGFGLQNRCWNLSFQFFVSWVLRCMLWLVCPMKHNTVLWLPPEMLTQVGNITSSTSLNFLLWQIYCIRYSNSSFKMLFETLFWSVGILSRQRLTFFPCWEITVFISTNIRQRPLKRSPPSSMQLCTVHVLDKYAAEYMSWLN